VSYLVAFAIGGRFARSVNVETFGMAASATEKIAELINEHFDLRPGAISRD
jgi:S-adenosylmethionine synthetase